MKYFCAFCVMCMILTGCVTTTYPDGRVEEAIDVATILDVLKHEVPELLDTWTELKIKWDSLDESDEPDLKDELKAEILRYFVAYLETD